MDTYTPKTTCHRRVEGEMPHGPWLKSYEVYDLTLKHIIEPLVSASTIRELNH